MLKTILKVALLSSALIATTFRLTGDAPGFDPVAAALFDALVAAVSETPTEK